VKQLRRITEKWSGLLQINGYAKFVSSFLCKKGIFKHFLGTFLKKLRVAVNLKQAKLIILQEIHFSASRGL